MANKRKRKQGDSADVRTAKAKAVRVVAQAFAVDLNSIDKLRAAAMHVDDWVEPARLKPETMSSLVHLHSLLGSDRFADEWELCQEFLTALHVVLKEGTSNGFESTSGLESALLYLLESPKRLFHFGAPLSQWSHIDVDEVRFGTGDSLRLVRGQEDDGRDGQPPNLSLFLLGSVESQGPGAAWYAAQRILEEVIGALIAKELATLGYMAAGLEQVLHGLVSEEPVRPGDWGAFPLEPGLSYAVGRLVLAVPEGLSEHESRRYSLGKELTPFGNATAQLSALFSASCSHATRIRNACRVFFRAHTAAEIGEAITFAFFCLEGLLLNPAQKESVVTRIKEAVAQRIGRSVEGRAYYRKLVDDLYELRCDYVHQGAIQQASKSSLVEQRYRCLEIARLAVARDINEFSCGPDACSTERHG